MAKDSLAAGAVSATFIPEKTVSQDKWDAAFKGGKKKEHKKDAWVCKDCGDAYDTAREFSDHVAACGGKL